MFSCFENSIAVHWNFRAFLYLSVCWEAQPSIIRSATAKQYNVSKSIIVRKQVFVGAEKQIQSPTRLDTKYIKLNRKCYSDIFVTDYTEMTTFGATSNENVFKMTTFLFRYTERSNNQVRKELYFINV